MDNLRGQCIKSKCLSKTVKFYCIHAFANNLLMHCNRLNLTSKNKQLDVKLSAIIVNLTPISNENSRYAQTTAFYWLNTQISYWINLRLLIELGFIYLLKKYSPMNNMMTLFTHRASRLTLALVAGLVFSTAYADELKDISQMADQGQGAAAIDRINKFVTANPKNAQALFMKGVLLAEQGRRDEAIRTFTDVTEKFPNLPEPYNNLAVLYADQGQFDKARKALETAIKTHPSYATAHENLGDIYARMASEAYDKALQLDTGNARAQGKLSLIKDLFGTGNKTTIAAKENKAANPVRPAEPKTDIVVAKPTATTSTPAQTPTSQAANAQDDVKTAVNNWAQAWSSQNVAQYLASYSDNFKPAKGLSKKAWEEQRRERVARPGKIVVELTDVRIDVKDTNTATAKFKQRYVADGKPIRTNKTLFMTKTTGNWLISEEIADN